MPSLGVKITSGNYLGALRQYQSSIERRMEYAALVATDRASTIAKQKIRTAMQGAGLGNLGNALGSGSDLSKGRGVHRRGAGGWSASGWVHVRSKSARTRGTLQAYTEGAKITPKKGPWLWFPSDEIQRVAGSRKDRARLTPGNWVKYGMDKKVGPLVKIKSVNGYPLLVVKNTNVPLAGIKRKPRASLKSGRSPKGYVEKQFLVAFIGIPFTSRKSRVSISDIMQSVQAELPRLFLEALGANG